MFYTSIPDEEGGISEVSARDVNKYLKKRSVKEKKIPDKRRKLGNSATIDSNGQVEELKNNRMNFLLNWLATFRAQTDSSVNEFACVGIQVEMVQEENEAEAGNDADDEETLKIYDE